MKTLKLRFTDLTPDIQEIIYNSADTMQTIALKQLFDTIIPEWAEPGYTYSEKMLGPVMTMMRRGIKIDLARRDREVAAIEARFHKVANTFQQICEGVFGTDINYNSSPQLKALFYQFLAIPEMHKFAKGEAKVSTDRKVLERIAKEFTRGVPFANLLMRISDLEKQIEFLTKGLSPDGRFHASYNISGTETFRFSSSEHPLRIGGNAQNVPPDARAAFIADDGYTFFQADQQGAEARLVAYLSGDENYLAACEGGDAHTMVASMVFGFEPIRELAEREYYRGKSYRQVCKSGSHGCLTADHEVLTPNGWVSIATKPTVLAAWDKDFSVKWDTPSHWTEVTTSKLVSIEGAAISSLSTTDHKFIVNADGKFVERTASTLRLSDKIPYVGYWQSGTINEPLARLVAAYQADGSGLTGSIRFKLRRQRKIARLQSLLAAYPNEWGLHISGPDTIIYIFASLANKICAYGKIAGPKLLQWDQQSLAEFAEESIYWDGTEGASGRRAVCSVNLEHIRWMQTIYQLVGKGSKVIDNTGKQRTNAFGKQRPHWVSQNNRQCASINRCTIQPINQTTTVYCPTTSTGYFLVRRNGHIYVTGNSNYYGKPFTLAQQMGVETEIAEQFQTKYFRRFPGIPDWHNAIAKQLQETGHITTPFGLRRTFWGRRFDDATLREAIAYVPQSTVGVLTNIGLHNLWSKYEGSSSPDVMILANGHDAVIGQIKTEKLDALVPEVLDVLRFPFYITDVKGKTRQCVIPFDMEVGDNWGKYNEESNPKGLKKWKPKDAT